MRPRKKMTGTRASEKDANHPQLVVERFSVNAANNDGPQRGSEILLLELCTNSLLPRPASPRLRQEVPPGYGVQEQCLPFTAATGLGMLIPSPISFGFCAPSEVPLGARAFRSPVEVRLPPGEQDSRVYWVQDDPARGFAGNAFILQASSSPDARGLLTPGISFFDRNDQVELCKLHLPYVLRTAPGRDLLFMPLLNRSGCRFEVLSGLVEADWYTHPVNLVLRRPAIGSGGIAAGEPIAQVVVTRREDRPTRLRQPPASSEEVRLLRQELAQWDVDHAKNRSAYKAMARSRPLPTADNPRKGSPPNTT
jgi:hypothetical protein